MKRFKIFKYLFFLSLLIGIERLCYFQTKGFRLSKIISFCDSSQQIIPPSLHETLKQKFYLFDKGVQAFVFIGEDKKTILKLFKRKKHLRSLIQSLEIAQEKLPKETGMLYFYKGKNQNFNFPIILYDHLKIVHTINLADTIFVLQKKAIMARNRLTQLLKNENRKEALVSMKKLLMLVYERSLKGIKNKDCRILTNCGFIDDRPVEIDVGSYRMRLVSTNLNPHKQLVIKSKKQLLNWVKKHYPKDYDYFEEHLSYEDLF